MPDCEYPEYGTLITGVCWDHCGRKHFITPRYCQMKPSAILWWLRGQEQQHLEMRQGLTTCLSTSVSILRKRNCPRSPPVLWAIPQNTSPSSLHTNVCWKIYKHWEQQPHFASFHQKFFEMSLKAPHFDEQQSPFFSLKFSSHGIFVSSTNLTTRVAIS